MTLPFDNFFPKEVVAFLSKRPQDFSLKLNQSDLTEEQKNFLSSQLDIVIKKSVNIRQVHGDNILFIPKGRAYDSLGMLEDADGIVTDQRELPILVRTADCVPVFLHDSRRSRIGLIHAGWKGTHKQILKKALVLMSADPGDVKIAFGPSIRPCCYEVGREFEEYFPGGMIEKEGKNYLDLVAVNVKQAVDSGVKRENILDLDMCTCCNTEYLSYRREGEKAGRMISLMMLRGEKYE